MKLSKSLIFVLAAFFALTLMAGCDSAEDAAEELLEEITDFDWELNEDDFEDLTGVATPHNWEFIFAVDLDEAELAARLDESFEVDLGPLADLGIDFGKIDQQVIIAKAGNTPKGDAGLRYANKIFIDGESIKLDGESIEKLGDSIGSSGIGWYAAYLALEPVGFIKGEVTDCDGNAPAAGSVLVVATDGPFFTFAAVNGSWALPSLEGKPASVGFDAGDCAGSTEAPVPPVDDEGNLKDPGTEPGEDPLEDDTNIIDGGTVDLGGDDGVDPPPVGGIDNFDFESGLVGWEGPDDCFLVDTADYAGLFPGGDEAQYGFITSGGNNRASCTVTRTVEVPAGATTLVVSYNFLSQEYFEWINSAYNDIFTIMLQGETQYLVHRTINDVAFDDAWADYGSALGNIATSADATANVTGKVFDGQLNWASSADETPRGGSDSETDAGRVAEFAVEAGETLTIIITVSDVADLIYDSAAVIDYFEFR